MTEPDAPFAVTWCAPQELLCQRDRILVGECEQAGAGHAGASLGHGLDDGRMAVPENGWAKGSRQIQKLPPALFNETVPAPADKTQWRKAQASDVSDDLGVPFCQGRRAG